MKKIFIAFGSFFSTLCLSTMAPAYSQTVLTCPIFEGYVPVEQTISIDYEPAFIAGEVSGSQVNVRTGPGTQYDATAYGLVGDAVQVLGQAFSRDCETWVKIRFPISGHVGWVSSNFIELYYGRGWWD
jgi:hypothetical protein